MKWNAAEQRPLFRKLQPARPISRIGDGLCSRDTMLHSLPVFDRAGHARPPRCLITK
jgi:hypothetical protein